MSPRRGLLVGKHLLVPLVSLFSLALLLGFIVWLRRTFFPFDFSPSGLVHFRASLLSFGLLTPIAFCCAYGLRCVFYIPEPALMMFSGFLLGPIFGPGLTMAGMLLACLGVYAVGELFFRAGGERFLKNLFRQKILNISQRKFLQILWVWRMLPFFPFATMSYGSFLMRVPLRKFLGAMAFGVIPSSIFYAYIGCFLLQFFEPSHVTLWSFSFIPNDWHVVVPFILGVLVWGGFGYFIQAKFKAVPK